MTCTLPTYQQAADECRDNTKPSALAWFITEQEPGGIVEEAKFRRELQALVEEIGREAALSKQIQMEQHFASKEEFLLETVNYRREVSTKANLFAFKSGAFTGFLTCLVFYALGRLVGYLLF